MTTATTAQTLVSPADVIRLLRWSRGVALDLETSGPPGHGMDGALNPRKGRIRLLSLSTGDQTLVMDCFEHDIRQVLPWLEGKIILAHNAAFDLAYLHNAGLRTWPEVICTYQLSRLLDGTRKPTGHHGLAGCVRRYLGRELPKELQVSDWSGALSADQIEYARRDSLVLIPLFQAMGKEIEKAGLLRCSDIELRALPAFVWMGQSGVPFNRAGWLGLAAKAEAEKERLAAELVKLAPPCGSVDLFGGRPEWNWDSPAQIVDILGQLGFRVGTSNDAQLAQIEHPFARTLRDHRTQATLLKMYGPNWLEGATIEEGRVYPDWHQVGTETGRTSCKRPNMQQLPRGPSYRSFIPAPADRVLVKADYTTLQMRIACKWAKDDALMRIFQANGDPHTHTAQLILNKTDVNKADRQIAKSANFGLLFGMSAAGLRVYSKTTWGVDLTEEQATLYRDRWFRAYPGLGRWHAETRRRHCKETRAASGRRRLLWANTPDTERLNSPVQADEADGLKLSLALLWEGRDKFPGAHPVIEAHDEIVLECSIDQADAVKAWLTETMIEGMTPFLEPVPVDVEARILPTWGG